MMRIPHLHLLAVILCVLACHVSLNRASIPCPPREGGLLTSGEPKNPSPFHDVTAAEISRLYSFLRSRPELNLGPPQQATLDKAFIYTVDLLLPRKADVLQFLDGNKPQPERKARVIIFRGDKPRPVVEEYRVGPLSKPTYARLIRNPKRRNSVPFAIRPISIAEFKAIDKYILPMIDEKINFILMESYGANFTQCGNACLTWNLTPKGTALVGEMSRLLWMTSMYAAEYFFVYPVDIAFLVNMTSSDPSQWSVIQVWYSNTYYPSLEHLVYVYRNGHIDKTRLKLVPTDKPENFSTIKQRGEPFPEFQQSPPVQLEPDGKRYQINYRHVIYLQWSFDVRMSSIRGPQAYDVRYKGERIAYELGLSEIAVVYSGGSKGPFKLTDYVDSGVLLGLQSKSLVEGADCPVGATFLSSSFLGETLDEAFTFDRAMCIFEHNTAVPLFRHMSYARVHGSFYGGMADSALIFRSILTVGDCDYIVDMVFRQDGSIEMRAFPTGYILGENPSSSSLSHSWILNKHISGNLHHHLFHFKADLDVGGTSNRYDVLHYRPQKIILRQDGKQYNQARFERKLKRTEDEAVFKYNFSDPLLNMVYNNRKKTESGVPRSYRIEMRGMSKQLLPEGLLNERTISWARQQMAVTVYRDNEAEAGSSSSYGMYDSLDPVVNFSQYINNEDIMDKDLVFWFTLGTYHLPHTEDLPVTPTTGGDLSVFLLPYNYFPECPAVSSRDLIRVELQKNSDRSEKVSVSSSVKMDFCKRLTLQQLAERNPDALLQTTREVPFP